MRISVSILTIVAGLLLGAGYFLAQDSVSGWLPVHAGDSWTYQVEDRDGSSGGRDHPNVRRWTMNETIESANEIREGTLILKRVTVPEEVPGVKKTQESHELVRENCVYMLDGPDAVVDWHAVGPDNQLVPNFKHDLMDGKQPPDFCFPIAKKSTWGRTPNTSSAGELVWTIRGINLDPYGLARGMTFHLTSYLGSGTGIDRWFAQGVGVLQEIVEHHGTYEETRKQLTHTAIDGKDAAYSLEPAHTMPSVSTDCEGNGWQSYVRENGRPFENMKACVSYAHK